MLVITLTLILSILILFDLGRWAIRNKLKFRQVYGDEESYFARLGQMDRLRWLAHEAFMRKSYGVKMIDDTTFDAILNAKDAHENMSVDPPNYNILANQTYQ
jgi:hypothetical protein